MRTALLLLLCLPILADRCPTCERDARGRIKRSAAAIYQFRRLHPCPATGRTRGACPGYVIDHIKPLACGGADRPSNLQWQTVRQAKEKDRWELKKCFATTP